MATDRRSRRPLAGDVRPATLVLVATLVVGAATATTAVPADRVAGNAPKRGGSAVFALEAETSGGYCLPDAILAASGIQVINAIYDTLVTLNSKGEYVPYLAKSVEPNADYTQWTITLREGIEFHNGEPLDAEAVKLNIDTYRGDNPNIRPGSTCSCSRTSRAST